MKVKDLIKRLERLDQDEEIGILYTDDEDDKYFPSQVICIANDNAIPDKEIKWRNNGYYMF